MLPLAADLEFERLVPPHRPVVSTTTVGPEGLGAVEAVLLAGPTAWTRLRAWRAAGVRCGAVILTSLEPAEDRPRLEPVVLLRQATPDALEQALEHVLSTLEAGELGSAVALAGGTADLAGQRFLRDDGAVVSLTALEARLLAYLGARRWRSVHRDELQMQVWDHTRPLATKAVDMAVARLRQKIEVDPSSPRTILTVRGGGYRAVAGTPPAPPPAPTTTSASGAGRFVGRTDLLAVASAALGPGCAVALVGPPGVGKSRLARELAARSALRVVDLEAPRAGAEPATALATWLDVHVGGGEPITAVAEALGRGGLLLDHADGWDELLKALVPALASKGASLLLTAQVAPTLPGVTVLEVPPLTQGDGVALLRERAGGLLDEAAASSLVHLLDGLPLAIELAAAKLAPLGVDGLRDALAEASTILSPEGAGRHGSVGAAVADAWDRLPPEHQDALADLTVFQAPFTLAAGAAVLGRGGPERIVALASRSLLSRDGPRFRLLHAVRDHARSSRPDRSRAQAAHARWLVGVASDLLPRAYRFGGREAFAELARLDADLLAALDHAAPADVPELVGALHLVWVVTGTEADRASLIAQGVKAAAGDRAAQARIRVWGVTARTNADPRWVVKEAAALRPELTDADMAGRLALAWSHALRLTEGSEAADACLRAVDLDAVRPATALRVQAALAIRAWERDAVHHDALQRAFDDLVTEGEVFDALLVGAELCASWFQSDPARAANLGERLVAWEQEVRDPRPGAAVRLTHARALGAIGRVDEALASLDRAAARLGSSEQALRRYIAIQRGMSLIQGGRHAEALPLLEEQRAWVRSRGAPLIERDIVLRLIASATDRLDLGLVDPLVDELATIAERLGRPDDLREAAAFQVIVAILDRRYDRALTLSERVMRTNPHAIVMRIVACRLNGAPDLAAEAELERSLATGAAWAAPLRAQRAAFASGDLAYLRAATEPARTPRLEDRLTARCWAALLEAGGNDG